MSLIDNSSNKYNTLYIDNNQLKGKNTPEGEKTLLKTGKPLVEATKEQVIALIERNALTFNPDINSYQFIKHFEDIQEKIQLLGIDANEIHLDELNQRMIKQFSENVRKKRPKPQQNRVGIGAQDISKNLRVNSQDEYTQPLSDKERAYIKQYLSQSPLYNKWKMHFEMLQIATESLPSAPVGKPTELKMPSGNIYPVYDLDGEEYEFLGCSGVFDSAIEDHEGYKNNKWPYLCISLVDDEHIFFREHSGQIFQILAVPPETIFQTHQVDAFTPETRDIQNQWVPAIQRSKVIIDRIFTAHLGLKDILREKGAQASTPLVVHADEAMRAWNHLADVMRLLQARGDANSELAANLIGELRSSLDGSYVSHDTIKEILTEIDDLKVLDRKSLEQLSETLTKLVSLLHSGKRDTRDRPAQALKELEKYFAGVTLSPEEQKETYLRLFGDDPTGKYDIKAELKKLDELLENLPPQLGLFDEVFPTRLLGRDELGSLTPQQDYNEVNIDTSQGKIEVKGWIIPKKSLRNADQVEKYLEYAKKENIPVFIRSR